MLRPIKIIAIILAPIWLSSCGINDKIEKSNENFEKGNQRIESATDALKETNDTVLKELLQLSKELKKTNDNLASLVTPLAILIQSTTTLNTMVASLSEDFKKIGDFAEKFNSAMTALEALASTEAGVKMFTDMLTIIPNLAETLRGANKIIYQLDRCFINVYRYEYANPSLKTHPWPLQGLPVDFSRDEIETISVLENRVKTVENEENSEKERKTFYKIPSSYQDDVGTEFREIIVRPNSTCDHITQTLFINGHRKFIDAAKGLDGLFGQTQDDLDLSTSTKAQEKKKSLGSNIDASAAEALGAKGNELLRRIETLKNKKDASELQISTRFKVIKSGWNKSYKVWKKTSKNLSSKEMNSMFPGPESFLDPQIKELRKEEKLFKSISNGLQELRGFTAKLVFNGKDLKTLRANLIAHIEEKFELFGISPKYSFAKNSEEEMKLLKSFFSRYYETDSDQGKDILEDFLAELSYVYYERQILQFKNVQIERELSAISQELQVLTLKQREGLRAVITPYEGWKVLTRSLTSPEEVFTIPQLQDMTAWSKKVAELNAPIPVRKLTPFSSEVLSNADINARTQGMVNEAGATPLDPKEALDHLLASKIENQKNLQLIRHSEGDKRTLFLRTLTLNTFLLYQQPMASDDVTKRAKIIADAISEMNPRPNIIFLQEVFPRDMNAVKKDGQGYKWPNSNDWPPKDYQTFKDAFTKNLFAHHSFIEHKQVGKKYQTIGQAIEKTLMQQQSNAFADSDKNPLNLGPSGLAIFVAKSIQSKNHKTGLFDIHKTFPAGHYFQRFEKGTYYNRYIPVSRGLLSAFIKVEGVGIIHLSTSHLSTGEGQEKSRLFQIGEILHHQHMIRNGRKQLAQEIQNRFIGRWCAVDKLNCKASTPSFNNALLQIVAKKHMKLKEAYSLKTYLRVLKSQENFELKASFFGGDLNEGPFGNISLKNDERGASVLPLKAGLKSPELIWAFASAPLQTKMATYDPIYNRLARENSTSGGSVTNNIIVDILEKTSQNESIFQGVRQSAAIILRKFQEKIQAEATLPKAEHLDYLFGGPIGKGQVLGVKNRERALETPAVSDHYGVFATWLLSTPL